MARWPWIERTFNFDFPIGKFPDIVERVRGTPARIAALTAGVAADVLTSRDDKGWSIQENVGHLRDVDPLMMMRIDEILAGAPSLTAADMSGRKTHEADHNARRFGELSEQFSRQRHLDRDRARHDRGDRHRLGRLGRI